RRLERQTRRRQRRGRQLARQELLGRSLEGDERVEHAIHPVLERRFALEDLDGLHEAQARRLAEVDLALEERLERAEPLGLVEAAGLHVLQDVADVEERLV